MNERLRNAARALRLSRKPKRRVQFGPMRPGELIAYLSKQQASAAKFNAAIELIGDEAWKNRAAAKKHLAQMLSHAKALKKELELSQRGFD